MNSLFFLKKYFKNFNLVCMYLGMCMYVQCPLRPEEGVRFFGVGVTSAYDPSDKDVEN